MIGVVVVFRHSALTVNTAELGRELLGAPLIARSVAASCPAERQVRAVVAVPESDLAQMRDEIIPRFGLIEVREVYAHGEDFLATLRQGVELLGEDVEVILLHDGKRPLVTHELTSRVVDVALEKGAAAAALPVQAPVVQRGESGLLQTVADRAALLQTPQAAKRELVLAALERGTPGQDLVSLLVAHNEIGFVDGDRDNLLVVDEVDVARCIEVWSRRAVDFPFLWPRPDGVQEPEEPDQAKSYSASGSIDDMLSGGEDKAAGPLDQAIAATLDDDTVDGESALSSVDFDSSVESEVSAVDLETDAAEDSSDIATDTALENAADLGTDTAPPESEQGDDQEQLADPAAMDAEDQAEAESSDLTEYSEAEESADLDPDDFTVGAVADLDEVEEEEAVSVALDDAADQDSALEVVVSFGDLPESDQFEVETEGVEAEAETTLDTDLETEEDPKVSTGMSGYLDEEVTETGLEIKDVEAVDGADSTDESATDESATDEREGEPEPE